jgi:hypothetical protein
VSPSFDYTNIQRHKQCLRGKSKDRKSNAENAEDVMPIPKGLSIFRAGALNED